jgi:AmiR/NasT family two-component response regulator
VRHSNDELAQRHRVARAQAIIVSVQAHCSFGEALPMMQERAKLNSKIVGDIADAVLDHRLSFSA